MTPCLRCGASHAPAGENEIPQQFVGELCTALARVVAGHDPNFLQGNPTILRMPVELPGAELVVVLSLNMRGRPIHGPQKYNVRGN